MTEEQFKTLCDKIDKVGDDVTFHGLLILVMIAAGVTFILINL